MDDSDPSNIERVGHRRWCLNPGVLKTGFGISPSGSFAAKWSIDSSRKPLPEYDFVAYPADGFAPVSYFAAKYAWSFSPNPRRYQIPDPKAVTVKVYHKTDRSPDKPGTEVKLNHFAVNTDIRGSGTAVIFRPQLVNLSDGSYLVIFVTTF